MAVSITLDSTNINSGNYTVRAINHESVNIDINAMEIVREDGIKIISTNIKEKEITIEGVIKGTSISNFESNLDSFRQLINVSEGTLDIEYAGSTRRYNACLANFSLIRDYYNTTFAKYTAKFIIPDSVGTDTAVTETLSVQALTETTSSWNLSFGGSAEPKPAITYIMDTAGNLGSVRFTNNTTDTQIEIGTAWSNGDQLVIDTLNRTVQKNSSNVDFEGVFPRFVAGSNSISSVFSANTINQNQPTFNTINYFRQAPSYNYYATGFKVSATTTYNKISLYLKTTSIYPTDSIVMTVQTDSGGVPSGTIVTNSTVTVLSTSIGSSLGWIDFVFSTPISLTSGTQYHIVLDETATNLGFGNGDFGWAFSSSSVYSNGSSSIFIPPSWFVGSGDYTFRIYQNASPTWSIDKKVTYTKRYL